MWLKAYMLPEILGISVPDELLALAPSTYSGFNAHAETVRQKKHDCHGADGKTSRQCQDETDTSNTQQDVSDLG